MTRANGLSIEYYHGLSGLAALRSNWDRIYQNCRNKVFYNDWRWHCAIQKHLLTSDVCYVYVSSNETPVAVLPLHQVVRKRSIVAVHILEFPYHVAVDLSDMLVAGEFSDAPLLGAIVEKLAADPPCRWDMLQLTQFTERSCFRRQADLQAIECSPIGRSAYVSRGASALGDGLSKKQVKNVRRHQRNAEGSFGACTFSTASTPGDIERTYETFLKVESSGWKGDDGTKSAIILRPDARAFYGDVLRSFGETGNAVVNVLRFGEEPVAAQIGLRTTEKLNLLKIGFDETYRDYGPGGIALLMCLDLEATRVGELSLVTCPPWSDRWHFVREEKYLSEIFNRSLFGRLLRLVRRVQGLIASWQSRSVQKPSEESTSAD